MKSRLACFCVFIRLLEAHAEVIFQQLSGSQSLELSCSPPRGPGSVTGLHLYHRGARSQTTLLSLAEGGGLSVDPGSRRRLRLSGGLRAPRVNVTISQLRRADSGLYVWELSYREDGADRTALAAQTVFLLVEGTGGPCRCSPASHAALLFAISAAAALLLLALAGAAAAECVKAWRRRQRRRRQQGAQQQRQQPPPVDVYEEMTWKQRGAGAPQDDPEGPAQPEEADFPLYANPNVRQSQDNYYACPRQLALRA